ncbi:MAG TPA: hypothetical protein VEA61_15850 [Allosphingosinicella sp.]|nr:hypothetical protein [Allosphingosinicella sp.]
MRFRPIVLAAFLSAATSAAAPPTPAPRAAAPPQAADNADMRAPWCNRNIARHAQGAKDAPRAEGRRLGELPPGDLYLTVYQMRDGCYGPVLVREGYGGVQASRR